MTEPFLHAWLKLKQSEEHIKKLQATIAAHIEGLQKEGKSPLSLRKYYWPRGHCILVLVRNVEPLPLEWGLTLGDALHNLRSALDHIAWRLVEFGTRPPESLTEREHKWVQFPIHSLRQEFNDWLPKRLPGVRREHRAIVRRYQPFKGGKRRAHLHPFALLNHFSNADKHRVIQATNLRNYQSQFRVVECRDFAVTRVAGPSETLR